MLKDILAMLDKWPLWKRIKESPARLDELEKRINALEEQLAGTGKGRCPRCGAPRYAITKAEPDPTFGILGGNRVTYTCSECGFSKTTVET